jgi:protocatechuate 3,4-dioxygenase beta subunit
MADLKCILCLTTGISTVTTMTKSSTIIFIFTLVLLADPATAAPPAWKCVPTPRDEIGPFYHPNAPLRSRIGSGYLLEGTIRSAATCRPIPGARVEFWQAGPDGQYSDAYRATVITDSRGRYRLETSFPPPYARRPAHIHILVDMRGYAGLITQHYPKPGTYQATFDLTMETE